MADTEDIFTALNIIYIVDKTVGPVFYSLTGQPGSRNFVIKKRDVIIIFSKIIFGIYLCFLTAKSRLNTVSKYQIEHIPEFSGMLSYFLLFLVIPVFEIVYRKKVVKIYYTFQKVCCYLKKSGLPFDYILIKKYGLTLFGLKMLCSTWVVFGYLEHRNYLVMFFLFFANILTVCVEVIKTSLLYCFYKTSVKINFLILEMRKEKKLEKAKISLHEILNVHYDIYELCIDINTACNYVILQFFISYSSLIYSAFKIAKEMQVGLSVFWYLNTILWNIFNIFVTAHIIYRGAKVKNEVRILHPIDHAK